jgi:hypothetical protein
LEQWSNGSINRNHPSDFAISFQHSDTPLLHHSFSQAN